MENDRKKIIVELDQFIAENGQPEFDDTMARAIYEMLRKAEWECSDKPTDSPDSKTITST
jgi:hypothetical protein